MPPRFSLIRTIVVRSLVHASVMTGWYFLWVFLFGWWAWEYHEELVFGDVTFREFINRLPRLFDYPDGSRPWIAMLFPIFFVLAILAKITEITHDPNKIARRSLVWSIRALFKYSLMNLFFASLVLLTLNGRYIPSLPFDNEFIYISFFAITLFVFVPLGCWHYGVYVEENSAPWCQPRWPGVKPALTAFLLFALPIALLVMGYFGIDFGDMSRSQWELLEMLAGPAIYLTKEYLLILLAAMLIYQLTPPSVVRVIKSTFSDKFFKHCIMYGITLF